MATSTPRPSVMRRMASTGSLWRKSITSSAPICFEMARRAGTVSTLMIFVAPISLAPAVAHRPIGPWAKTATVSPMRIFPLSAPLKPVVMMSGHIKTCSSESPSGTRARLAAALGMITYSAWAPSIVLPSCQPPMGLPPHWEW